MENEDSHLLQPAQFKGLWSQILEQIPTTGRLEDLALITIPIAGPRPQVSTKPLPPWAPTWLEFYMVLLKKMPADELQELTHLSDIKVELPQAGGWRPEILYYTWGEISTNALLQLAQLLPTTQQAVAPRERFYSLAHWGNSLDAEILKYLNNFITITRTLK